MDVKTLVFGRSPRDTPDPFLVCELIWFKGGRRIDRNWRKLLRSIYVQPVLASAIHVL